MTIENQIFGEALYEPQDSFNYPFDGTFGFGWSRISATDQKSTPINNLYEQRQIKKQMFCIKLHQLDVKPRGEFIIGGCDVKADFWKPLTVPGFWQILMTKIEVSSVDGANKLTLCQIKKNCQALFDTGMALIGGPPEELDAIAKRVGARFDNQTLNYVVECDAPNLPNIEYFFGEVKVVLTPIDYLAPWGVSYYQ